MDIDMYTYLLTAQQPPLPPPAKPKPAAPPATNPAGNLTRAQAREKKRKEKEELRAWWDDLPEDKRQEVRNKKILPDPPKPKKEGKKCECQKKAEPKEAKKPDPPAAPQPAAKPDVASVLEVRTWAIADM